MWTTDKTSCAKMMSCKVGDVLVRSNMVDQQFTMRSVRPRECGNMLWEQFVDQ